MSEPINPGQGPLPTAPDADTPEVPETGGRNRTVLIALLAVLGALLIGGALFFALSTLGGSDEALPPIPPPVSVTTGTDTAGPTDTASVLTPTPTPTITAGGRDPFEPIYQTVAPTNPTDVPTNPTGVPTYPTSNPTTSYPTYYPTYPTSYPTYPTYGPTTYPTTAIPTQTAGPTSTSTATSTDGPTPTTTGTGTATPTQPPSEGTLVELLSLNTASIADVQVNGAAEQVGPGETFGGGTFTYESKVSADCIEVGYSGDSFELCVGEAVVLAP
ncbi:MAG: hypothetical protein R2737_11600 [Candidatus Nanopelagicales bacterium]